MLVNAQICTTNWNMGGNTEGCFNRLGTLNNYDINFFTNSVQRGILTKDGKWGFGTNVPASRFHFHNEDTKNDEGFLYSSSNLQLTNKYTTFAEHRGFVIDMRTTASTNSSSLNLIYNEPGKVYFRTKTKTNLTLNEEGDLIANNHLVIGTSSGSFLENSRVTSLIMSSSVDNGAFIKTVSINTLFLYKGILRSNTTKFLSMLNNTSELFAVYGNGNTSIGTNEQLATLTVKGNAYYNISGCQNISIGSAYSGALGYGQSYIGFNMHRNASAGTWLLKCDNYSNGGAVIFSNIDGRIHFSNIPMKAPLTSDQTKTDGEVMENVKMTLDNDGCLVLGKYRDNGNNNDPNKKTFKLIADGAIGARKVIVTAAHFDWYDCVFEKNYELPKLNDVEKFVTENKHLPDIPSQAELEKNGQDLGEMNALLLKKVEELYLYTIQQQKEIDELKNQVNNLTK